jgi:hypothetical protein
VLFESVRLFNEQTSKQYVISTINLRLNAFVEKSGLFGQVAFDRVRLKI